MMIQPKPKTETKPQDGALDQTKRLVSFGTKFDHMIGERKFHATISTAIADHDGEVLLPSGMDKSIFNTNPLFMLYHKQDEFPLGCWDASRLVQRTEGIAGEAEFIERGPLHPMNAEWLPDTALWYVQTGIIKAVSVGLIQQESRPATTKDLHVFGPRCNRVTSKWTLIEISLCNSPTNHQSLIDAVGQGLVGKSLLTEFWEIPTRRKKSQISLDSTVAPDKRLSMIPSKCLRFGGK